MNIHEHAIIPVQQKMMKERDAEISALEKVLRQDSEEKMQEVRQELSQSHEDELQEVKEQHQREMDVSALYGEIE